MSYWKWFVVVVVSLLFTACYPISNVEKNLVPPLAGANIEELRSLIELRFPGFQYHDSKLNTSDSRLIEITDFYESESYGYTFIREQNKGALHLLLLSKKEQLVIESDILCLSKNIQKISWSNIQGNAKKELLISYYSEGSSNSILEVYSFEEEAKKIFSKSLSNWEVAQLETVQATYLYAVVESMSQEGIRLYTLEERDPNQAFKVMDTVHLDLNYGAESMFFGQVNAVESGIFIDGNIGAHSGVTELVMSVNGKLKSVFQNEEGLNDETMKPYYTLAVDIDHDGIIEVPFMTPAIGDEDLAMYEISWISTWKEYSPVGEWVDKMVTIGSYGLGTFELPKEWVPYLGVLTNYASDNHSTMTFYYDNGEVRDSVITFYFVPYEVFDKSKYNGMVILEENPLYVIFFIKEKENPHTLMELTDEEIIRRFTPEPEFNY